MRPTVDFSPSVWRNHFLSCVPTLKNEGSQIHQNLENMKENVRSVLQSRLEKPSQKLNLVDNIQRLGVSYHFESEIEEILQDMHKNPPYNDKDVDDLFTVSLWFRLLRQHGYMISCDIFEQFKEDNGNFKIALINDVLGMLSLYEAANLRIHGEDVLDQALEFTTFHLKSSLSDMSPNIKEKVIHALNYPVRKTVPRLETRYYISVYSKEMPRNDLLLQFAMLDFNLLQAQHQKELGHLTESWRKLDLDTKAPHVRQRLVESYFWSLAVFYEPKYTIGREIVFKIVYLFTALDDTYDAYATIEELELFTEAIQRCNIRPIDSLEECIKVVFKTFMDMFDEFELLTAELGTSSFVPFVKRKVQKVAQAYLIEAKWRDKGYTPSYDEYLKCGATSSTCPAIEAASFLGLGNILTREVWDWLSNHPKIIKASGIIGRLLDDIGSREFEQKREHVASSVECCMNQHGISEAEALKLMNKDIENCWKDMNEDCLKSKSIPMLVLECVLNLIRMAEYVYAGGKDKFTHGELMKDDVAALLVNPIQIEQEE